MSWSVIIFHNSILKTIIALISNFRRVLNIVCVLLGISPASDCDLPTFRNPLSVPSSNYIQTRVQSKINQPNFSPKYTFQPSRLKPRI
jgi:hypothetical protein